MGLGWQELLLLFFIVLLIFGANRIPDIARSLGKATREFKKAKDSFVKESQDMMDAAEKRAKTESEAENKDKSKQD